MKVLQLVFETVYDDKKELEYTNKDLQNISQRVNLPCCKANLHAPRTCAVVQICLWQSLQEVSVVIFHLCRLDGDGKVS